MKGQLKNYTALRKPNTRGVRWGDCSVSLEVGKEDNFCSQMSSFILRKDIGPAEDAWWGGCGFSCAIDNRQQQYLTSVPYSIFHMNNFHDSCGAVEC